MFGVCCVTATWCFVECALHYRRERKWREAILRAGLKFSVSDSATYRWKVN
jgi:hypothetical protein